MSMHDASGETEELEYEGHIPPTKAEVERDALAAWRKAWAEDPQLRQRLRPENPGGEPPPLPVTFTVTQGADPLTVTLVVMAATAAVSVGKTAAMDLWKKVILPRLERKWGEESVKPVKPRPKKK